MNFLEKYKLYKKIIKIKPNRVVALNGSFLDCSGDGYYISCTYDKETNEYNAFVEYPGDIVNFCGFLGKMLFNNIKKHVKNGQVR